MKNTRILSMLLAATLALASLPLMATVATAEEAPAAMEKGDKIAIPNKADNWTGITAYDESYASAWLRGGGYNSFLVQLYKPGATTNLVTAGTEYVAKLAVRTPDATFAAVKPVSNATKWDSTGIVYMIHSQGSGSGYLGTRHSINTANLTTTPTEYSITFTVPTDTTKTWSLRLHESGGVGTQYASIGVSGIIVYEAANPDNVVYSWGQFSTDSANKNWALISTFGQTYHGNVYLGADLTSAATSATYDVADTPLLPGVYQLTGNFATDFGSVELSAFANDTAMNVGVTTATSAKVDAEQKTLKYTLTLTEETTLTTLGFAWDSDGAANKLMLSDLSFKCVELLGDMGRNASIKRGTVVAGNTSVAFWSTEDGDVCPIVDKWWNFPTLGKGYIRAEFDAKYDEVAHKDTYITYVIMKHNGEDGTTVRIKFRQGPSGYERYNNITTEWAEYKFNTGGFYNATSGIIYGQRDNLWFYPCNTSGAIINADIDIRGILTLKNNTEVVYAWGSYADDYSAPPTTGNPTATLNDESVLTLTPDADGSTFNYDAAYRNITLAPGTYVVSGNFAAASGMQTVQLGASAADGTMAIGKVFTVGEDKSPVTVEIKIQRPTKLSDISVIIDGGTPVYVDNIKIAEKPVKFRTPHVGIFMMLF